MKKRILPFLFVLLLVIPLIEISCQHKEEKGEKNTDELEELIGKYLREDWIESELGEKV